MSRGQGLRGRHLFDSRAILVLSVGINAVIGIILIGLTGHNLRFARSDYINTGRTLIAWNVTINDTEIPQSRNLDFRPEDFRLGSYWMLLSWGIGSFLLYGFLGGLLAWRHASVWREESRTGEIHDVNKVPQTPLSIVVGVIALCWSIASTTYSFVQWQHSGTFQPSDNLYVVNGRYSSARDQGYFTPDAWYCQYEDFVQDQDVQDRLEGYCAEGTSLRILSLVTTVLGLALLVTMFLRNNRRSRLANEGSVDEWAVRNPRGRTQSRDPPSQTRESMAPTIVDDEKSDGVVGGVGTEATTPTKV